MFRKQRNQIVTNRIKSGVQNSHAYADNKKQRKYLMQHLVPMTTQLPSAANNARSQSAQISYRNVIDQAAPPEPREKSPIDIQIEYLKSKIELQKARERTSHQVST